MSESSGGWRLRTSYRWRINHRPTGGRAGYIRVKITDERKVVKYDLRAKDNGLRGGRLGPYSLSQAREGGRGCSWHWMAQFALCTLQFAICNLQFAICNLQFAICTLHFALCTLHFAHYTLHFALGT